jgi:hypothetical protein
MPERFESEVRHIPIPTTYDGVLFSDRRGMILAMKGKAPTPIGAD